MKPTLNIIVPCYNPPQDWEKALAERLNGFRNFMGEELVQSIGLVVVNDGSSRQVGAENLERLRQEIPGVLVVDYAENRGKGYALRQGVLQSNADLQLVTDADFPYTFESMQRIVASLVAQGGIAAGNRDTAYYQHVPFFRRLISRFLRWMLRNILKQPISDSQCGLKGFDEAGKAVFLETSIDRFLFDLEFLMLANKRVEVTPVPVQLREGVVFSRIGWKILATEGRNFLKLLFK